jgi:aryl-alcohol dehydrogenase-like predicted oxidoreductase
MRAGACQWSRRRGRGLASKGSMATETASSTQLETRRLGASELDITRIGFGAWAIGGGDWEFAWGHQEDQSSIAAIERALELGLNWIDTAPVYGLGHSEEVVGRVLRSTVRKPYVFTKCSMRWDVDRKIYRSLKGQSLREELESSLRRLGVDVIDLYQIHWPNPEGEIEEGWETLARFKQEGKVRYIGVSNFSVAQMERVRKIAPITSLQPPYSLVNRKIEEEVLPYCAQHNIGVIAYSPMASGLLTGKMTPDRVRQMPADDWRRRAPQFQEPKLSRNLQLVEVLREMGRAHDVEPGVVAVAWTLRQPAVTGAIVGARNAAQVQGTFPAASLRLAPEEIARIDGFVREHLRD